MKAFILHKEGTWLEVKTGEVDDRIQAGMIQSGDKVVFSENVKIAVNKLTLSPIIIKPETN